MYLSPLDTRATLWSCPSRETIDISSSYDTYEPHRLRAHGEAIVNVIPWQLKLPLMQDCMRIRSLCMSNTKEVITMWNLNRTKKCSEEWSAWNFMKCVPMEISLFYVSVLVSRLKNNFKKVHGTFNISHPDMSKAPVCVASLLKTAPLKMLSLPQMGQWRPRANTPSTGVVGMLMWCQDSPRTKAVQLPSMFYRSKFWTVCFQRLAYLHLHFQ